MIRVQNSNLRAFKNVFWLSFFEKYTIVPENIQMKVPKSENWFKWETKRPAATVYFPPSNFVEHAF